jgi:nucleolar protein 14
MAEVMAKSKDHKARRQLERQEDADLRMELDDEFDALRSLLTAAPPLANEGDDHLEKKDADYDAAVRSLAFDQKAKAKDRTKTEEELAAERAEMLEKAEKRRLRRMQGLDEEGSDDEEGGFKARRRAAQGDDLDDDFIGDDEVEGLGAGLGDEAVATGSEDDSNGESEDEGDDASDKEQDEEEDPEASEDSDLEDDPRSRPKPIPLSAEPGPSKSKRSTGKAKSSELPYTFPCPSTHDEFLDIITDIRDEDVPTVVQRIRTLYHPSLAETNKNKLQDLARVLVDHILHIAQPPAPSFSLASALLPHLHALAQSYPSPIAAHIISKLALMEKNLKRGLSLPASPSRVFPALPELALLRTAGALFPPSDMHHPVLSPARLLVGAYLALGLPRVRALADLASGLFLCGLCAAWEARSRRLVPEAVAFCVNAVARVAPARWKEAGDVPGAFPLPEWGATRGLRLKRGEGEGADVAKPNLVEMLTAEPGVDEGRMKVELLSAALKTLSRFAEMYKDLDGFIELFQPVLDVFNGVQAQKLPQSLQVCFSFVLLDRQLIYHLQTQLASAQDALGRLLKFARQSRRPLLLQAHKPIPIPTYLPKFSMSTSGSLFALGHVDPDRERAEAQKLRRQYKQEKKGAMRELRKDARFMADVREKEQREKDEAYEKRMRRVAGNLEGERAEEKQEARAKEREKQRRRAGRK